MEVYEGVHNNWMIISPPTELLIQFPIPVLFFILEYENLKISKISKSIILLSFIVDKNEGRTLIYWNV